MHPQRIAIAVTALIGALCPFLPWLDVPFRGSVIGFQAHDSASSLSLLCGLVIAGMFVGKRERPLTPGGMGLCRIGGGMIVLIAVYVIGTLDQVGAHVDFGPYFQIVVGIAVAVLPNIVKGAVPPDTESQRSHSHDT